MSLHLYVDNQFLSPYALSVFVTLREKGIPFDVRPVDLGEGEQRGPGYARLSLTQRVPTLVEGDFALSESSAICEYLEERFPEVPVYPRDLQTRARARQVQAWLRSDLGDLRAERTTEVVFQGRRCEPFSPAGQAAADKLLGIADRLLPEGSRHLFGQWSIVDADLAVMLQRLVRHGDPVPPRLSEYADRQWQRASMREWIEQPRPGLSG